MKSLFAAALLILPASASGAQKQPPKEKSQELVLESAGLRTAVPAAWQVTGGPAAGRKTQARSALGPESADGVRARLGMRWYGPDNKYFKDAAAYLARQTEAGPIAVAGEKTGALEDAKLLGRPAKRLSRSTFEVVPPESLEGRSVPVKEELLVADYRGGFVVLELRASAADFDGLRPVLERAAAGLSPAKPRAP